MRRSGGRRDLSPRRGTVVGDDGIRTLVGGTVSRAGVVTGGWALLWSTLFSTRDGVNYNETISITITF